MKTPERTTAEVFPRYIGGEALADSATLKWTGLFVRRYRFLRVVDGFLVPATAEPLIACFVAGSAEFQEREIGGAWLPRRVRRGDLFVTRSKTPYELRWNSPLGAELEVVQIHLAKNCGSPGAAPYRCRYEWITISTKSGLSKLSNRANPRPKL
jgi:AraC family transcriptional regulator